MEGKFKNKALDESTLFQTHEKRLTSFDRRRARFDSRPGFRRRRYSHSRRVNSRAPLLLVSSNVQLFSNCVVSLESQLRVKMRLPRATSVSCKTPPHTARTTSNNATTTTLLGDERTASSSSGGSSVPRRVNTCASRVLKVVFPYKFTMSSFIAKNGLPFDPPFFLSLSF